MVGLPNNHVVFLLKMIMTWGVKWGENPLFSETSISQPTKGPGGHRANGIQGQQRPTLKRGEFGRVPRRQGWSP